VRGWRSGQVSKGVALAFIERGREEGHRGEKEMTDGSIKRH
jgi:hypothetical protein